MRVELTEHLAHDTGGLLGLAAVAQAQSVHAEEHAPLYRLQAIAGVRKGAGHDDGHRIVDVGGTHLVVDFDRFDDSFHFFLNFFGILNLVHKNTL